MSMPRVVAFALLASASLAPAQQFPSKPIRFIVPYTPGGGTDLVARTLGQKLTDAWNQQVIIENRPGAQGNVGTAAASKAPADGYTIVLGYVGALCINPFLYPNAGFDPNRDFAPITLATQQPYLIVVHPSVPAKSIKELIALAKTNPGKLSFGSSGSLPQLAGELMKYMAGIDMVHVPYKGAGPALIDLIGGQLDLTFTTPAGPLPFIRSGRLRVLAVTSSTRTDIVPDAPTVVEAGIPGFEVTGWYGVLAPAGTPKEVVARLNAEWDARKIYHKKHGDEVWSAIQITTAASICAVLDLHIHGQLPASGFVKQEQIDFEIFLANRFGQHYVSPGVTLNSR